MLHERTTTLLREINQHIHAKNTSIRPTCNAEANRPREVIILRNRGLTCCLFLAGLKCAANCASLTEEMLRPE